jgi:hypothetical protein
MQYWHIPQEEGGQIELVQTGKVDHVLLVPEGSQKCLTQPGQVCPELSAKFS